MPAEKRCWAVAPSSRSRRGASCGVSVRASASHATAQFCRQSAFGASRGGLRGRHSGKAHMTYAPCFSTINDVLSQTTAVAAAAHLSASGSAARGAATCCHALATTTKRLWSLERARPCTLLAGGAADARAGAAAAAGAALFGMATATATAISSPAEPLAAALRRQAALTPRRCSHSSAPLAGQRARAHAPARTLLTLNE